MYLAVGSEDGVDEPFGLEVDKEVDPAPGSGLALGRDTSAVLVPADAAADGILARPGAAMNERTLRPDRLVTAQ